MIDKAHGLPFIQHKNQNDCRALTRNVRQPKFEKSQSYNTLHFIRVTELQYLTFYSKKVLTSICFQKQKGRLIKPDLLYAFVNVHYVNVNPSILT